MDRAKPSVGHNEGVLRVDLRPAELVLVFSASLAAAILVLGRPEDWAPAARSFMAVALAPLLLGWLRERFPSWPTRWVAGFFPGLAFFLIYDHLNPLSLLLHPALADARLQEIDRMLFGVQPAVWLAPHIAPWVNDVLMACYSSYFLWPTLIGVYFMVRGREADFDRWVLAATLFSVLNFVFYILVPAMGPRFMLAGAFSTPIRGRLWAGALAEAFRHSPFLRDCFPSGHTALTLMVLVESWRRIRPLFWTALPVAVGLIAATVACRFHYGIDLVAAVPFAVAVLWLSEWVFRTVPSKLTFGPGLVRTPSAP